MQVLLNILQAVQILSAIFMVGLILMQHGKGADAGAAFGGGGGGSASLFGASGSANFLSRTTAVLAAVFLASTLGLAYFGNLRTVPSTGSVLENTSVPTASEQPSTQQIPMGTDAAAPSAAEVPAPLPATGEAQIPAK
ncbi:preprotein translocase subunit SecG [Hydrogenophaga crassostreae]|uniref:Protein-export membrane protein SecG n=1 Tax=Hydrogenophaga crassostreae TaxID=1763535 RepID=A0A163CMJ5_9BURK|nr:preprotein translocase subunit SecG [Hydrogenophaga crassostreae]AOW14306.1 preprotein translocase subunit SecG [Hydrogenophaga crassostreae]OAD43672.1 preprotein translocase subunit SecG [Hydrogenophaga crassostreae]